MNVMKPGAGIAAILPALMAVLGAATPDLEARDVAKDPGVRVGPAMAGGPLPDLTGPELSAFLEFKEAFEEVEDVADGLGPRFNLDSCAGCHSYPATGGTSGPVNPQIAVATKAGARNAIPWFLDEAGPIREARRLKTPDSTPDGGVVPLFVISGRSDSKPCALTQPDFSDHANFVFRIPTPVFGMGLIEAIPDRVLRDNLNRDVPRKKALGIRGRLNSPLGGRLNTSGNDGTVTRFGWKAQNESALIFAGEAYNVEMGISNDMFPQEREERCVWNPTPDDRFDANLNDAGGVLGFAVFMRFLDQPRPAKATSSAVAGRSVFDAVGCALCHTPALKTGKSSTAALSEKWVNLYSDLALHRMGTGLADGVTQGQAGPDEFRTAP